MTLHIEFVVNRLTMRVQHRAAELAVTHQLGEVLFPAPNGILPNIQLPNFRYVPAAALLKIRVALQIGPLLNISLTLVRLSCCKCKHVKRGIKHEKQMDKRFVRSDQSDFFLQD